MDADVDPPITARWFPAWMALQAPDTVRAVKTSGVKIDPARAFSALIALATGGNDRQDMDNRRTLQSLHPGLFNLYLDAVEA